MPKKQIARVLDEDELEEIAWRAGRGCHFEGGFLFASEYGKQVIQEDVPLLIAEIRKLRAAQQSVQADLAIVCDKCGRSAKYPVCECGNPIPRPPNR